MVNNYDDDAVNRLPTHPAKSYAPDVVTLYLISSITGPSNDDVSVLYDAMNVSTASLEIEKIRICDASHCKYRPSIRSDCAGMLKLYDIPDARALAAVAPPSST